MKNEVQELVRDGCNVTWESYKLESFVQKFSELIFNFQERVDDVLLYTTQIDALVLSLETCEYKYAVFKDVLDQMQKLIDDLNLRSYSNLSAWVKDIDLQVREGRRGRGRLGGRGEEGGGGETGEEGEGRGLVKDSHSQLRCLKQK